MSDTQSYKTVTFDTDEWYEVLSGLESRIRDLNQRMGRESGSNAVALKFKAAAERALEKVKAAALSEGLRK